MAIGTPSQMLAQATTTTSPWTPSSVPAAAAAGQMLVIIASGANNLSLSSVTDTPGNTWTVIGTFSDGTRTVSCAYCINSKAYNGTTDKPTLTWSANTSNAKTISMHAIATMPLAGPINDKTASNTGTTSPGSCGPTAALSSYYEICWYGLRANALTTFTPDWSSVTTPKIGACGVQYKIVTSAATVSASPTLTGTSNWVAGIWTFKGPVNRPEPTALQAINRAAVFMRKYSAKARQPWERRDSGILVPA